MQSASSQDIKMNLPPSRLRYKSLRTQNIVLRQLFHIVLHVPGFLLITVDADSLIRRMVSVSDY